jgi:hypothetical protein
MTDVFAGIDPKRARWCPECNGYGSSLKQETGRCTRCGGSGLVAIPDAELERAVADGGSAAPRDQD